MRHVTTLLLLMLLPGCYVGIHVGKAPPQPCTHQCQQNQSSPYNLDLRPWGYWIDPGFSQPVVRPNGQFEYKTAEWQWNGLPLDTTHVDSLFFFREQ